MPSLVAVPKALLVFNARRGGVFVCAFWFCGPLDRVIFLQIEILEKLPNLLFLACLALRAAK